MSKDEIYLKHILDALQKIESYVSVGEKDFFEASHWQDAVIRKLEIIGEATKRVSKALKSQYPNTPWRKMAGLRDVLIHDYMGVDIVPVWEITQQHLPSLKNQIQTILSEIK